MNLLNHGYIELVEHWGSDERIIEAARTSTQKGFQGWEPFTQADGTKVRGDKHLLRYLRDNDHASPFAFAGATFAVKAPLFVIAEWQRHQTQQYNQASARYAPLPHEDYVPTTQRVMVDPTENKQASGTGAALTAQDAAEWTWSLVELQGLAQAVYQAGLDLGVPKELARLAMPVSRFTKMVNTGFLRFLLDFLVQRLSPNAQHEIRVYAQAMQEILSEKFPRTLALFNDARDAK